MCCDGTEADRHLLPEQKGVLKVLSHGVLKVLSHNGKAVAAPIGKVRELEAGLGEGGELAEARVGSARGGGADVTDPTRRFSFVSA